MNEYLNSTYFFNYEHPGVKLFVEKNTSRTQTPTENAIQLFYAVRDGWQYKAEKIFFHKKDWQTSSILKRESGHCMDKANVLIAAFRLIGLPARLHLVKVRNHIAAERVMEKFQTDELTPHAFAEVYLRQKWIAVTPTFNQALCEKLDVEPLDWDGASNALFQQFSRSGHQFMEYLADYGHFADLPFDFVFQNMYDHYPGLRGYFGRG